MTIWQYQDAAGVDRKGAFLSFSDRGGTDVTYKFHRLDETGAPIIYPNGGRLVDLVSGARLKAAAPVRSLS